MALILAIYTLTVLLLFAYELKRCVLRFNQKIPDIKNVTKFHIDNS